MGWPQSMWCQLKPSACHSGTKAFGCCPIHNLVSTAYAHLVLFRTAAQAPALAHVQTHIGGNAHGIGACARLCSAAQGPTLMAQTPAPHPCSAAAWVALRPQIYYSVSQGPPTSTKHTPGPRVAASATRIPALLGPDTHTLVSASTFGTV